MKLISKDELKKKLDNKDDFKKVRRYAGGIADWERAGFPLEGEMID